MLLGLSIENFALIEKLDIYFDKGLNVLTGETGAGKSIIIDAVNMAIGERADKSYIRNDADKTVIQMMFTIDNEFLERTLQGKGIDVTEDHLVILTREIYHNGRSICRINDRIVTVSLVREISKHLIDIHGQHAHQSLLYSENHVDMLDSFEELRVNEIKEKVSNKFLERKSFQNKLLSLYGNELEIERKKDLLRFQLSDIDEANLKIGEEEELVKEQMLLVNSERIFNIMSNSYEKMFSGDEQQSSIIDHLGNIVNQLQSVKEFDHEISSIYNIIQDCLYQIQDVSVDIRNYRDHVEFNPQALDGIVRRLDIINNLKRKYGKSIEEILSYREKISLELDEIENSKNIIADFNNKIEKTTKELYELSIQLRDVRKLISKKLEVEMANGLVELNMERVVFEIHFTENVDKDGGIHFTANGIDKVEFMISTNPGQPPKPLSKIASGGEMSRIMLAFKTILARYDNIPTLIFDEIDTGISGHTANAVGEKLAAVSRTHQILCITHLPQIALMADEHFFIEKISNENSTLTNVRKLGKEETVCELGRLLGGTTLTELTIEHAREMLEIGNQYKSSLK